MAGIAGSGERLDSFYLPTRPPSPQSFYATRVKRPTSEFVIEGPSMQKPMSEDVIARFSHEIRVRINEKTHLLYVLGNMGCVVPRTLDSEGVEMPLAKPLAWELRPLDVVFGEIMAARELMRSIGIHVSLEGI